MLRSIDNLRSFLRIVNTLCFYRLYEVFPNVLVPVTLRFLFALHPWSWFSPKNLSRAARVRTALEKLGPLFVKLGQMLSTRRDLLPDDIADGLALLQDRVAPFPSEIAIARIESALGGSIDSIFSEFSSEPLASASIAQVHAARLKKENCNVVVKVLRPDVLRHIERDIRWIKTLCAYLQGFILKQNAYNCLATVEEFETTLRDECDLTREAANASQLHRNVASDRNVKVPKVFWHYVRSEVLVMERVGGVPIGDLASLEKAGIDLRLCARRLVEMFFIQAFRDSFFHADLHPGNIFVTTDTPHDPRLVLVDFGLWGSSSAAIKAIWRKIFWLFSSGTIGVWRSCM